MKRAPLAALCLWLALSPASAADSSAVLARAEAASADHSPASAAILDDGPFMAALRAADPGKAVLLIRDKAQLRDLDSLVQRYPDADSLRRLLRTRADEFFDDLFRAAGAGPVPEQLVDWVQRYYGAEPAARFREAVWSWPTLPKEALAFLQTQGLGEAAWGPQPFRWREAQLEKWAKPLLDEIESTPTPWTSRQAARLQAQAWAARGLMSMPQWNAVWTRINNQRQLGEGLSKLQGKPLSPQMKAQLSRARDPNLALEAQLEALSRVFENSAAGGALSKDARALARERQSRDSERFTPEQLRLLADMLPRAYLQQVAKSGYTDLDEYYKKHKLDMRVEPTEGALAMYDPGSHQIRMSIKEVEAWVRLQGVSAQDLLMKKAVFDRFIMQSSPLFVHEATHQVQFETAKLEDAALHSQAFEIHAMFEQTVYLTLLSEKDKRFRDFLKDEAQTSSLAVMNNQLRDAMRESPRKFRQLVASSYYCAYPTLHAVAARHLEVTEKQVALYAAELKRRGAGPGPEKADPVVLARAMAAGYSSLTAQTLPAWIQARPVAELQAMASALRQDQLSHADWYTAMERWDRGIPAQMDTFWKEHFAPAPKAKPASGPPAKKAGP